MTENFWRAVRHALGDFQIAGKFVQTGELTFTVDGIKFAVDAHGHIECLQPNLISQGWDGYCGQANLAAFAA